MAWTLKYIAGGSMQLYTVLTDGTGSIDRDVPLHITDIRDYNRLMGSGEFQDVTEYPEAPAPVVKADPITTAFDAPTDKAEVK